MRRGRRGVRVGGALAVTALAVTALVGCSGGGDDAGGQADVGAPVEQRDQGGDGGGVVDDREGGDTATVLIPDQRDLIASAWLVVRVDDVATTLPRLAGLATGSGGYVASEDSATDPDDPASMSAVVVMRVPTDRLAAVSQQVDDLGDVLSRQQEVQDVTEQVVDVDSRVSSARASVARIRVLLDRAESIADVVRIEGELARREADLESLLAQQRSLANQTSYATLSVTLVSADTPAPSDPETGFLVGLEKGWDAFTGAVAWSLTVLGALLPFVGLLLVVGLPALLLRRRRAGRRAANTPG